ncbi:MAG: hypothetical protein OXT65_05350 [Alphaproteobacteria bacterium]|nr:hypothetical protein [Alphaproteobacteria bacterium]
METAFNLLRQSCGMSFEETAEFLAKEAITIKHWCNGTEIAPQTARVELFKLTKRINKAANKAIIAIHTARKRAAQQNRPIILSIAPNNMEARMRGWPFASVHNAIARRVLERLTPEMIAQVKLAPYSADTRPIGGQSVTKYRH